MRKMTMRFVVLLALAPYAAFSQSFESVSIQANHSGSVDSKTDWNNGAVRATNVTLKEFIQSAYNVRADQISGPDWLSADRFDIAANAGAPVNDRQTERMLQALLADRFHLSLHRETRDMPGYALVIAKAGSKLKPAPADGNSSTRGRNGQLTARHISVADFTETLAHVSGLRIVDQTGLQGVFDFTLDWNPSPSGGPSLLNAVDEQLGLHLDARQLPVEILVVDHIDRAPAQR